MILKDIAYRVREDLKNLFRYPDTVLAENLSVDYDKYWKKRRKPGAPAVLSLWQKERADRLLAHIERGSSVMDIGCGDGAILAYLGKSAGVRGVGVDMSEPELERARKLGIEVHKADLRDPASLSALPTVDYIIGFEIIEHMANPEEIVAVLAPKARKGMVFSFPNSGYYPHRLRFLLGRFPLQWIHHPSEHLRFWTVRDAKWWVASLRYELTKLVVYQGIPVLNKILPTLFGQGIMIFIRKK